MGTHHPGLCCASAWAEYGPGRWPEEKDAYGEQRLNYRKALGLA